MSNTFKLKLNNIKLFDTLTCFCIKNSSSIEKLLVIYIYDNNFCYRPYGIVYKSMSTQEIFS